MTRQTPGSAEPLLSVQDLHVVYRGMTRLPVRAVAGKWALM